MKGTNLPEKLEKMLRDPAATSRSLKRSPGVEMVAWLVIAAVGSTASNTEAGARRFGRSTAARIGAHEHRVQRPSGSRPRFFPASPSAIPTPGGPGALEPPPPSLRPLADEVAYSVVSATGLHLSDPPTGPPPEEARPTIGPPPIPPGAMKDRYYDHPGRVGRAGAALLRAERTLNLDYFEIEETGELAGGGWSGCGSRSGWDAGPR